jgi:hypothetical protein
MTTNETKLSRNRTLRRIAVLLGALAVLAGICAWRASAPDLESGDLIDVVIPRHSRSVAANS